MAGRIRSSIRPGHHLEHLVLVLGAASLRRIIGQGQVDPDAPSTQAEALVDQHFGGQQGLVILVTGRRGAVDRPAVQQVGTRITAQLAQESFVSNVTSYFATPAPYRRTLDRLNDLRPHQTRFHGGRPIHDPLTTARLCWSQLVSPSGAR